MKKALAQNPNLLRTLIGLSVTLIFMLSYAVYGATVSPSVYIYKTEPTVDQYDAEKPTKTFSGHTTKMQTPPRGPGRSSPTTPT